MNPKADFFFTQPSHWQAEYKILRKIVTDCGITEEVKWGCPCYTVNGKNVVLIHGFKEYCALLFMKGALLSDKKKILVQQSENVQSARQLRFTTTKEITNLQKTIQQYIYEAIEIEKTGIKVTLKQTSDYAIPEEFQQHLSKNRNLKAAFEALTPGRQRAYLFHFAQAKQSKTREARIQKLIPQILNGKGLND